MKKLLSILFCLAFAAGAADAGTYYVDATRPNNNGNGLKLSTAKKSIQAAVNLAKEGDTILVYPGTYAPIKTNNKKITVKSVKGTSKTEIVRPKTTNDCVIAQLGKGSNWWELKGKNTLLTGFRIDGRNVVYPTMAAGGGLLKSCCIQRVTGSGADLASEATLTGCIIRNNSDGCIYGSILSRSKIMDNVRCGFWGGRLSNCLVTGNKGTGYIATGTPDPSLFWGTVVVNCTIVKNCTWYPSGKTPVFSYESKFYNCILRNNYHRTRAYGSNGYVYGKIVIHNTDTAKTYSNTYYRTFLDNRNPSFSDADKGDYKLKKGSTCIDKGRLTDSLKKLAGTLDMAGKTRVRGSYIDLGCYEY